MITSIEKMTVYVRDEEEALRFYTEKLGFEKRMDLSFRPGTRWLTVAPKGGGGPEIVLHNPAGWHGPEDAARLSAQIGKTPPMIFGTKNCRETCDELKAKGVTILAEPQPRPHGVEAMFADLYGNAFVLVEPKKG
ncbi:MAG: VOC family protein [Bacillota bacterium]